MGGIQAKSKTVSVDGIIVAAPLCDACTARKAEASPENRIEILSHIQYNLYREGDFACKKTLQKRRFPVLRS